MHAWECRQHRVIPGGWQGRHSGDYRRQQNNDNASDDIDRVMCTDSESPKGNQQRTSSQRPDPPSVDPVQGRGERRD